MNAQTESNLILEAAELLVAAVGMALRHELHNKHLRQELAERNCQIGELKDQLRVEKDFSARLVESTRCPDCERQRSEWFY